METPMPKRRPTTLAVLLSCFVLAPAFAQTPPPAPPDNTVVEIQGENLEEAIKALEPLRNDPKAPPQQLALLGVLYLETGRIKEAQAILAPLADPPSADPAVLYNAGRAALAAGQREKAETYFERSVAKAPGSPSARELGFMRARQERSAEAYRLLRPWAMAHATDLEARIAAALLALQFERLPDAELLLSDLPQNHGGVRLLWAQLLVLKGQGAAALEMLQPVVEKHVPEMEADLARTLGDAYLLNGQAAEAIKALEGKVGRDPRAALILTRAYDQNGDPENAYKTAGPFAESLLAAAKAGNAPSGPYAAGLLLEYGRLLLAAGQGAKALPALERVVVLQPDQKLAWQLLGQAHSAAGDKEKAQKALANYQALTAAELPAAEIKAREQAEAADPVQRSLRRAGAAAAGGDGARALEILRQEAKLSPYDLRPRSLEVRVLLGLKQLKEALNVAEGLVKLAPAAAESHHLRGLVRMVSKEGFAAERDLRKALELDPDYSPALNDLAVLLMTTKKNAEAKKLLERALAVNPEDPVAKENLKKLG
jgi:predicted Zn-dependent protease